MKRTSFVGTVFLGVFLSLWGLVSLEGQGNFSAQIQLALQAFVVQANTWTGTQTFQNVVINGTCTGSGCGGGGSSPGGATNSVQYKVDASTFGGFGTWDGSLLTVSGSVAVGTGPFIGNGALQTDFFGAIRGAGNTLQIGTNAGTVIPADFDPVSSGVLIAGLNSTFPNDNYVENLYMFGFNNSATSTDEGGEAVLLGRSNTVTLSDYMDAVAIGRGNTITHTGVALFGSGLVETDDDQTWFGDASNPVFFTTGSTFEFSGGNATFSGTVTATDFIMSGSTISAGTASGHAYSLNAYDEDAPAMKAFVTCTNGNTPTCAAATPSGGSFTGNFSTLQQGGNTVATLVGTEALTNKTLTAPVIQMAAPVAVASLPTCNAGNNGRLAFANDVLLPALGGIVANGGALTVGVLCVNGTGWIVY